MICHLFAFGFEQVEKLLRRELGPWKGCNFNPIQQAGTAVTEGIHEF
jgi:hypothetical protein